jgi:hypothetical protein
MISDINMMNKIEDYILNNLEIKRCIIKGNECGKFYDMTNYRNVDIGNIIRRHYNKIRGKDGDMHGRYIERYIEEGIMKGMIMRLDYIERDGKVIDYCIVFIISDLPKIYRSSCEIL